MGESAEIPEGSNPQPDSTAAESEKPVALKWPGWPGDNVFRLIVPVLKVGSIIGRKGELVKKICDETRARVRVLEAPVGTMDRVVLISGKEEPAALLSPAMDAVLRVFKRVTGLVAGEADDKVSAIEGAGFCSIKLLVASTQAVSLIGKQGSVIKAIQESSSAVMRILSEDELPSYAASDERIVEIHGEGLKVLEALESVVRHLRKFLVDHSVVAVFEKNYNAIISQDRAADAWSDRTTQSLAQHASKTAISSDHSLSFKSDPYFDREIQMDSKMLHSGSSLYAGDSGMGGLRSMGVTRAAAPIVTQVTQTMQVPLSYAEDIIGIGGANIAYIRRTSGAILTVQESGGRPDEITVEIKGTSSEVQAAQQLIQDFINGPKEQSRGVYGNFGDGLSSYSRLSDNSYRPSSFSSHSLGGYGSPRLGGYSSYRF
ncbi:hypothetical protein Ancab_002526 [Ancistrocladus abbreviatus]